MAHHGADDGAPEARLAVPGAPSREERDPAALDAVAELGQHGRQDRERPESAIATTSTVPTPKDAKVCEPMRNMPAIAVITTKPENSTARPEVAAAVCSASALVRPRARSSRVAAQVEQRVVDADGQADQQDHRVDRRVDGMRWLTSAVSPSAAATAVIPSSSGMPAATSAPKATTRISSVTGSDVTSARWKSCWMRS